MECWPRGGRRGQAWRMRQVRHGRGEPGADGAAVRGQPLEVGADALQRRVPVSRLRQHVLVRREDLLHLVMLQAQHCCQFVHKSGECWNREQETHQACQQIRPTALVVTSMQDSLIRACDLLELPLL